MKSAEAMEFRLSLVKDAEGALDPQWIGGLARAYGLRGFIETGTYLGRSLDNVCGLFERAVSIELSTELHEAAREKFADRPHVTLLRGDSAQRILDARAVCEGLPTLYWLDAHWSAGNTARGDENTPILKELALIAGRVSANDIVLIDDMRYFITAIPPGFAEHEANDDYPPIEDVLEVLARFPAGGFEAVLSGDVLVCMSRERMKQLQVSPAVQAITALRTMPGLPLEQRRRFERQIARAEGDERDVFLTLPKHYEHSLQFGIGGDFCYWRALIEEADWDYEAAGVDLALARRCKVHTLPRPWEGTGVLAGARRWFARMVRAARRQDGAEAAMEAAEIAPAGAPDSSKVRQ